MTQEDQRRRLAERRERTRVAYQRTFCGDGPRPHPEAERVLADLFKFCKVNKGGIVVSPVQRMTDPYATIYRDGLRDVYLRVAAMLGLDEWEQPEVKQDAGTDNDNAR